MSTALIRDLAALERLRVAILSFAGERPEFAVVGAGIADMLERLSARESELDGEIDGLDESIDELDDRITELLAELNESNDSRDALVSQIDALQEERAHRVVLLVGVVERLKVLRSGISRFESVVLDYHAHSRQFEGKLADHVQYTLPSLVRLLAGAQDYMDVGAPGWRDTTHSGFDTLRATASTIGLEYGALEQVAAVKAFLENAAASSATGACPRFSTELSRRDVLVSDPTDGELICTIRISSGSSRVARVGKIARSYTNSTRAEVLPVLMDHVEAIARASDCESVALWASTEDHAALRARGYVGSTADGDGSGEFTKLLDAGFAAHQSAARIQFQQRTAWTAAADAAGFHTIDPLRILVPEGASQVDFWRQHNGSPKGYIDLVRNCYLYQTMLDAGDTHEQIHSTSPAVANAHAVFTGSEPVRLVKAGDYYRVEGGRHRVAAAQLNFLMTGERVNLKTQVIGEYR